MNSISNNAIRQVLLLLVILLLGFVLFWQLQSFLPAFLGAYTLFVLLKKWMYILTGRYKWKKGWAATLLMFGSFLIILLPIALLFNMLYSKMGFALEHSTQVLNVLQQFIHKYEHKYRMVISSGKTMAELSAWAAQTLPQLLGATFNTITTVAVMYFILYFMLIEGRKVETSFHEWLPLKDENLLLLRRETNSLVYSNAIGIPLIALLQGTIAFLGYLVLGVNEPGFWFVVTYRCHDAGGRCDTGLCAGGRLIVCRRHECQGHNHAGLWLWGRQHGGQYFPVLASKKDRGCPPADHGFRRHPGP